jgi:phospholipase/carboxylesterase
MTTLTGPRFGPVAPGAPQQLVVICHGVGANGQDLIALAPMLAAALPHAVFAAPDGPEPYDMIPDGHPTEGRQWFSLKDWRPVAMEAGVRAARDKLDRTLDETLAELGIPPTEYALAGFSQGAMMALFTGLRRPIAPRAILAYSGGGSLSRRRRRSAVAGRSGGVAVEPRPRPQHRPGRHRGRRTAAAGGFFYGVREQGRVGYAG